MALISSILLKTVPLLGIATGEAIKIKGSFHVSVKLPTYPSPKPTLTLSSYLGQNVGLGEGWLGSFPET